MKKSVKVIEINGFRGILAVLYAIICAVAGFVFFPAWAIMSLWNHLGLYVYNLPRMNMIHGFMLYAVVILIYYATNTEKTGFGISTVNLTKSHIAAMMKDIDNDK